MSSRLEHQDHSTPPTPHPCFRPHNVPTFHNVQTFHMCAVHRTGQSFPHSACCSADARTAPRSRSAHVGRIVAAYLGTLVVEHLLWKPPSLPLSKPQFVRTPSCTDSKSHRADACSHMSAQEATAAVAPCLWKLPLSGRRPLSLPFPKVCDPAASRLSRPAASGTPAPRDASSAWSKRFSC